MSKTLHPTAQKNWRFAKAWNTSSQCVHRSTGQYRRRRPVDTGTPPPYRHREITHRRQENGSRQCDTTQHTLAVRRLRGSTRSDVCAHCDILAHHSTPNACKVANCSARRPACVPVACLITKVFFGKRSSPFLSGCSHSIHPWETVQTQCRPRWGTRYCIW